MRVAVDSNVLLYFARAVQVADDEGKADSINRMMVQLAERAELVAPLQVLGECYFVMARKYFSRSEARDTVADWQAIYTIAETTQAAFAAALDLATEDKLQFWDALILSVAAEAGCSLLLSEDMQSGVVWRGVTVVNPFAAKPHPKLARLLAS